MNKTALLGLLMALALPLVGYFLVKQYSKDVTPMPRRYIYDSVSTRMVNGKQKEDTLWHRVPDFRLTNQLGQVVTWDSLRARLSDDDTLRNKVVVIDFFFTHCPTICPRMTENMKRLQDGLSSGQRVGDQQAKFVHLLSISVDPERDSVAALKHWADRFGIDPDRWWLLTGDKKQIYDLSINHLKVLAQDGEGQDTSFIHSDRMILLDKNRNIRGYYHGLDTADVGRLSRDIILVALEKDPKSKSVFAGKLETLAILVFAVIGGLTALFYFLKKDKQRHGLHPRQK
ncbi:SCO family protein [Flaviaesturariibacter aridisoli]|uniref:SCO family protein n=1 Tax=Flaviaesturariibacter aridisoli TaxID=2545761 RepID=A0A4R4E1U5_9BACT|nr:SCO family protein [Flaviaesturariibacter aridisoli]TCZ72807.1 SCO family protein [Flaviaesturariibacter aridisoli]